MHAARFFLALSFLHSFSARASFCARVSCLGLTGGWLAGFPTPENVKDPGVASFGGAGGDWQLPPSH